MAAAGNDCFKEGSKVEVCFDDMGFRGSWYTATVLQGLSKKTKKIYLEFDTLVDDEDPKKPLKEHVNIILVRPLAPREANRSFQLNEDVDAFHNDGWWEGVVTEVHPCSNAAEDGGVAAAAGPARYSVFFRSSREQIEFPASELRLHREWVYGEWVPPFEDDAAADDPFKRHQPTETASSPEASLTYSN